MTQSARSFWLGGALALSLISAASADVKLPSIFSDHMVLQQQTKAPVWGWADPGEAVTVTLGDQVLKTAAGADGKWRVDFAALKPGASLTMTIAGKNELTIHDVLIGEVWLCSGQSNMEFTISKTKRGANAPVSNEQEALASANYPQIRMFFPQRAFSDQPQTDIPGTWVVCSPQTVGDFSAVSYFFGRELHETLKCPVGLVVMSCGGSTAEAWMSRDTLSALPAARPILEKFDNARKTYTPELQKENNDAMQKWAQARKAAQAENKPIPPQPRRVVNPMTDSHSPTLLFNAMIEPVASYGIRGTIWYQGESNAWRPRGEYPVLQAALINEWRKLWNQGDFPFYFVQLPAFGPVIAQPVDQSIQAVMRDNQATSLSIPNTGMAVTFDLGDPADVHPKNKVDVGHRLALVALAKTYQKTVEYSGPVFDSMTIEGKSIRIAFTHADGMTARGNKLEGFAIAGKDKKFVWADARIDGTSVVISSTSIADPSIVSYAWSDSPTGNLYNKAGLPARPFRSDTITPAK